MRTLSAQLDPMRQLISQLKKEKDSANKKVVALEKLLEESFKKVQVSVIVIVTGINCLTYSLNC